MFVRGPPGVAAVFGTVVSRTQAVTVKLLLVSSTGPVPCTAPAPPNDSAGSPAEPADGVGRVVHVAPDAVPLTPPARALTSVPVPSSTDHHSTGPSVPPLYVPARPVAPEESATVVLPDASSPRWWSSSPVFARSVVYAFGVTVVSQRSCTAWG
ncbi:hypothetical protein NUM3379_18880 [Kineococcus sp. NUM-3379]